MTLVIRAYQKEDCPFLLALFYDTVHSINIKDYTKEQVDAWATGKESQKTWHASFLEHITLIALKQKTIVGFIDGTKEGYLDRLYVHKKYQRQGIATALCDCLEKKTNAKRMTTQASFTAQPFFKKRGYQVIKKQNVIRNQVVLENIIMEKRKR